MKPLPTALFLSHGGGPLPLLGDAGHSEMVACLADIAAHIAKPRAVVVVSAHWEARLPTVTSNPAPSLLYDYYGFPDESYTIQYPCPGEPALAREIHDRLGAAGIAAALDPARGLDHGVFVPMKIMYPEADIPCVQLSLVHTLDPSFHVAVGRALQGLSETGVLLIGSGFSFHNLRAFYSADTAASAAANQAFEAWLRQTCGGTDCSEAERTRRLVGWAEAPGARFCHPREEHLLPLHVCYGAAQAPCANRFELRIMNKRSSMYLW